MCEFKTDLRREMKGWESPAFRKLVEISRHSEANIERSWKFKYSQVSALKSLTHGG